jgi:hypothetical protein
MNGESAFDTLSKSKHGAQFWWQANCILAFHETPGAAAGKEVGNRINL